MPAKRERRRDEGEQQKEHREGKEREGNREVSREGR
jgi:hypothetical protein